jgi:hypothetical protein
MTNSEYLVIKINESTLIGEKITSTYSDSEVNIKNVYEILADERDDKVYYYMVPWFVLFEDQTVLFNKKHVICESLPTDQLIKMYLETINKYKLKYKDKDQFHADELDLDELDTMDDSYDKIDKSRLN